jgi:hypothetical protein
MAQDVASELSRDRLMRPRLTMRDGDPRLQGDGSKKTIKPTLLQRKNYLYLSLIFVIGRVAGRDPLGASHRSR